MATEVSDAHEEGEADNGDDKTPTHVALAPHTIQYPKSDAKNIPGEQPVHPARSALSCVPGLQMRGVHSATVLGVTPMAGCVPGEQENVPRMQSDTCDIPEVMVVRPLGHS